jgi:type VI secretion system protein ImpE
MIKIKEMIQQGRLADAISYLEGLLREDPLNVDYKSTFIELLCINGELERADKMLNNIVQKHPDFLIGASNLRQLIRAEQSRQDFIAGKSIPSIFSESDAHIESFMKLRLEITQGEEKTISESALSLETARPKIKLAINNKDTSEVRDLDDSLGGFIEIFGTDGKFYVAQLNEIEYMYFQPVTSLLEQVWRKVELSIKNGPSGEAHVPMVYGTSKTDAEKLGRETDWNETAPDVMTGVGQKMWFVNEDAFPMTSIEKLETVA